MVQAIEYNTYTRMILTTTTNIGSSCFPFSSIMFILQVHPEVCAIRSLAKTIPDGMHLIRDKLGSFFKGIRITFTDRPDELSIGIEVFCKEESEINRGGIIHKIWRDGKIGVVFHYVLPQAMPQTCCLIYNPGNVFQIFQSSVKTYNASKRWGVLKFNSSTFFSCEGYYR